MMTSTAEASPPESSTASVMTLRRLKIALFAAVIVPLVLFASFAWDERRQLLHAAEGEALASAATLREHAINTIETDELLLRQLDRRIQGMGWDEIRSSSDALSNEIGAMHAGMKQISLMLLTDAEGQVWAGTPPHPRNGFVSASHLDVWSAQREADQGTYFSHPYVGRMTGRVNFGISRRRSTPDGRFDGTVHVTFDASYLSSFWSEVIAGKDGATVALVRIDGDVLARFPDLNGPLPDRISPSSNLLSHIAAEPLGGAYRAASLLDGTDRIYAYARVGTHPLVVLYGLSVDSVLAPWRLHLLFLAGFGTLAAVAVALAALAAIRQAHQVIREQAHRATNDAVAQQGRRLENLGQLAAESAHDFANILQAMSAAATLIRRNAGHPERVRSLTDRLDEDVERGASLTQNMLDLVRSGGGVLSRPANRAAPVIDLTDAMSRAGNRLRRLLGDAYRLRWEILPAGAQTLLRDDRSELELVIINLAVNARDAMPKGGEVLIEATIGQVGGPVEGLPGVADLKPGLYVRLAVIDTGVGMSPEVLARAGNMFFTTKPLGKGTGLGLAGASGFAKRAGGRLTIDSEVGRGTTVTLWLPAIAPGPVSSPPLAQPVA